MARAAQMRAASSPRARSSMSESEEPQYKKLKMSPKPTFRGIPPELRNNIYCHALLETAIIHISPANPSEPALLQTCRQIRQEARGIYLSENQFGVPITDLDYNVPPAHWLRNNDIAPNHILIALAGTLNWQNLKHWLQRSHESYKLVTPTEPKRMDAATAAKWRAVDGTFHIVYAMRNVEWETVEKVLEEHKLGTAAVDGSWAWDGYG